MSSLGRIFFSSFLSLLFFLQLSLLSDTSSDFEATSPLFINKTTYSFWNDANVLHSPFDQNLLDLLEQHPLVPDLVVDGRQPVISFIQEHNYGLDEGYAQAVPMEYHRWGKHLVRSAKRDYTEICVVIDTVWKGFTKFITTLFFKVHSTTGKRVVFLLLSTPVTGELDRLLSSTIQPKTIFEGLNLFVLSSSSFSSVRRTATLQRRSILEVADLVISIDGLDAKEASIVDTPCLTVTSGDDELFGVKAKAIKGADGVFGEALLMKESVKILTKKKVGVVFHSYLDPTMGYGSSAEQMALGIESNGVSVKYLPRNDGLLGAWRVKCDPRTIKLVERQETSDFYLGYYVTHEVEVKSIPKQARKAKYSVIYTTFETTKVPSYWPPIINYFDKQLVSCDDIRFAFLSSGVRIPVEVVPLGVSVNEFPVLKRNFSQSPFRFLLFASGQWINHRKNYQLVYDAFLQAFGNDSSVELMLKVTFRDEALVRLEPTMPPNVKIFSSKVPQSKVLVIMRKAHCLVFPSHGEGFGLPPREAMATGIPVILPGFGGLESIANESFNYPLRWGMEPARGYDDWIPQNHGSDDFGEWVSIDINELIEVMLRARNNPEECARKGERAAAYVRRTESYDMTGKLLVKACHLKPDLFSTNNNSSS